MGAAGNPRGQGETAPGRLRESDPSVSRAGRISRGSILRLGPRRTQEDHLNWPGGGTSGGRDELRPLYQLVLIPVVAGHRHPPTSPRKCIVVSTIASILRWPRRGFANWLPPMTSLS